MDFYLKQRSVGETTYLVFDMDRNLEVDSFAMNMIAHNRIANIVPTQIVMMNEKSQIQFNITGLMKLTNRISVPRSKREVLGLFNSMLNAFEEVDAYMLDMEHLLLDWEYIYLDRQGNCMLMYLPFEYASRKDKISFLQEMASRIQPDYQEKDPYLFDILNAFSRGAILKLSDFRELIKKCANTPASGSGEGRTEGSGNPAGERREAAGLVQAEKEKKAVPEPVEKKPIKKSSVSPKIPVINIPGREPGTKEIPRIPAPVQEKKGIEKKMPEKKTAEAKKQEKKENGKKGFFRKADGKEGFFAIPKRRKEEAESVLEKGGRNTPDIPSIKEDYNIRGQGSMYESYESTVIIQEPVMAPGDEEGTVMLEQRDLWGQIPARLMRKSDGTVYHLTKDREVIGSGATADINIRNNPAISRSHATVVYINGNYYIEDNQSKNGSFINGRRLQPSVKELLSNGMLFKLANEEFNFFMDSF